MSSLSSFRRIALVILTGVVAGCTAIQAFPDRQIPSETALENDLLFVPADVVTAYYAAPSDSQKAAVRDAFVTERMAQIDFRYTNFLVQLQTEITVSGLGVDLAVLGMSAAGALLPVGGATRILAGTTAALTGARASYDKNVLLDRTIGALITQMEARRAQIRTRIFARIVNPDLDARYPLPVVQADLQQYYFAGTLPGAIAAVTRNAGVAAADAEAELAAIIVDISATTLELEKWLTGGTREGDYLPARVKLLAECATENNVTDVASITGPADPNIAVFLLDETREADRQTLSLCVQAKLK